MNVLVIDDEPQIRRALRIGLERNSYSVKVAANGEEGLDFAALEAFDVVILDLAMPGTDGLAVCRALREWSKVPILVLSVRESEKDKIAALDLGADDYLTKPFSLDELLARMRAVLRRAAHDAEPQEPSFSCGDLTIDFGQRQVLLAGNEIHLTPTEYELLKFMVQHANRVLTHQRVLLLGFGTIGRRLSELLRPFGCHVVAHRRQPRGDEPIDVVTADALPTALGRADHVVNLLPDNDRTRLWMNADRFAQMKPGARFYNIGRGTTVDQSALAESLRSRHLAAAWLDVTDPEPLPADHPLRLEPNCFITPHTAGGNAHEDLTLVNHFLTNFHRYLAGKPLLDTILHPI